MIRSKLPSPLVLALAGTLAATSPGVFAAGSHEGGHGHGHAQSGGHGHGEGHGHGDGHAAKRTDIGQPGDPANVGRTIEVEMGDSFFRPERIRVEEGETVRFAVTNAGKLVHEFNIATAAMHAAHQGEMMAMVQQGVLMHDRVNHDMMGSGHGMRHDHANSVLLEPGDSGEVVWQFTKATDLEFACNVPGHYEAGMKGELEVR